MYYIIIVVSYQHEPVNRCEYETLTVILIIYNRNM